MVNVLGFVEKKENSELQNDYTEQRNQPTWKAGFMLFIGEEKKKTSISLNHTDFFKMRIVLTNFLKNIEHIKTSAMEVSEEEIKWNRELI